MYSGLFLLLVILLFGVYVPYLALVGRIGGDAIDGFHGCHHGVVHVIVSVLAISAYAEQVVDAIYPVYYFGQLVVGSKICRIGFLYLLDVRIDYIVAARNISYLNELVNGKLFEFLIALRP